MSVSKPKDMAGYQKWLREQLDIDISERTRTRYETVTSRMRDELDQSNLWQELCQSLPEYDSQYRIDTSYALLARSEMPQLLIKPFESLVQKTFRKNVLDNEPWPAEPEYGWILPENWYCKINDILRTLVVVKYLDGVDFLGGRIQSLCEQHGLPCELLLEAREEGYYAAHIHTRREFEVPAPDWDTQKIEVGIELQITTQPQEVIRTLLHKYYEERRLTGGAKPGAKWQWDYHSDEFTAAYLGHILHYVEGMIMEIREAQREEYLS